MAEEYYDVVPHLWSLNDRGRLPGYTDNILFAKGKGGRPNPTRVNRNILDDFREEYTPFRPGVDRPLIHERHVRDWFGLGSDVRATEAQWEEIERIIVETSNSPHALNLVIGANEQTVGFYRKIDGKHVKTFLDALGFKE